MSYTLEQKREALEKGELWWRCPGADYDDLRRWTSVSADLCARDADNEFLCQDGTEYFIALAAPHEPTPPRVLSELEGELLEALKAAHAHIADDALRASIGNLIAKATGVQK